MKELWIVYFTYDGLKEPMYHQYNDEKKARDFAEKAERHIARDVIPHEDAEWYAKRNAKVVMEHYEIDPDFPEWQDYEPDEVEEFPLFNFPF